MLRRLVVVAMVAAACGSPGSAAKIPPSVPSAQAQAQSQPGPWLWKVEKAGAISWIYALAPRGVASTEIPDSVWTTLAGAERLVMDERPDDPEPDHELLLLPESESLEAVLGSDVYGRLRVQLEGRVDPKLLPRLRPRFLIPLLRSIEIPQSDAKAKLLERHQAAGKHVTALHSMRGHEGEISRTGFGAGVVREQLGHLELVRKSDYQAPAAYRSGRSARMRALIDARLALSPSSGLLLSAVLDYIMPLLEPELANGGALFVGRNGSLLMDGGVLDRLRSHGFAVERMYPGQDAVAAVASPLRWTTPKDCEQAYERILGVAAEIAAAKGQPLAPAEVAALRATTITIANLNHCLRLPLERVECMKAAPDRDAWTECLTAMVGQ